MSLSRSFLHLIPFPQFKKEDFCRGNRGKTTSRYVKTFWRCIKCYSYRGNFKIIVYCTKNIEDENMEPQTNKDGENWGVIEVDCKRRNYATF